MSEGVKLGRPLRQFRLAHADEMRSRGLSLSAISRELGVHRNTLLNRRARGQDERAHLKSQQVMLRSAQRYLKANLGEGLTPLEFRDAKDLVRLLTMLYRENTELRDGLIKARRQIRDLERALAT